MKERSKRFLLIFTILLVCGAADQITKVLAQNFLQGRPPLSYLGNTFRLEYIENRGAFLSLGANLSDAARFWFLTITVGTFTLGCLGYLLFNSRLSRLSTISFSLVIGGGISNLIDRMFRENGQVIDFMNMGIGSLRTGIFNIADIVIMVGVIGLLIGNIKEPQNNPNSTQSSLKSKS